MERRNSLRILAATTGAILASRTSLAFANEKKESDHKKHKGHHGHHTAASAKTEGKNNSSKVSFGELNHASAHCNHVAQMCAGHCLELIKNGQKSMTECLQAALEVQAMSAALSDLAGLRSELCAAQAKACILACDKCMKACEPHVGHHEQCKECFEACKSCMETCKSFAV